MCKIFTMTNMSKVKGVNKLVNHLAHSMFKRERDGFGYAIQGKEGVFGERTVAPKHFETSFKYKILDAPFVTSNYNRFGTKSAPTGAGIFHGRTSTNDKTLRNTHPISRDDWHLIHNGVVNNQGPKYEMQTTNDTEHLLHYLATEGIKGVESNLTGYYAVSAFGPDGSLHIFRDSIAPLYACDVEGLDSLIFATSVDLIQEVCKAMKWKTSVISPVTENSYIIFKDNQLVEVTTIKPKGETWRESKYSHLSLGYSRDHYNYGYDYDAREDKPFESPTSTASGRGNVLDMTLGEATNVPQKESITYPTETEDGNSDYTQDELEFLNEVSYCDSSYTFFDYHDNRMSYEEFMELSDNDKLSCTVIRADGTVCDPTDYYTEKLYSGVI